MAERNKIEVDEERMMRMMAADVPSFTVQKMIKKDEFELEPKLTHDKKETVSEPEISQEKEEPEPEVENVKGQKKKRNFKPDFAEIFLKDNKIKDRRQIYISKEAYDKISRYLKYIGEGKVSLVSYVDNIIFNHMDEYRDTINDLYNKNISTPL